MRNLKNRIKEHLNTIRSGNDATLVSRHFKECNGSDIRLVVSVQGIERVTLGMREVKWIYKLCTRQPNGLNSVFDISCFF
ncbi:hypothetical protein XELAEV_18022780mg [Xenopus laevis]|uniref:Uncharacterized protein n=1 Tax=Xenopus laevis TaxID=8355 RepID=A0A974D5K0_XENLA|nr:hypothetical protein XELAEV_18022780mg [Xenopus laevis]